MTRVHNFSAGPAVLPLPVLERIQSELLDWNGSGMSVLEMSHRGKEFIRIYEESLALLRNVAGIPDRFDILYMTGGASAQFVLVPWNLSARGRKAAYVNTGAWSQKAIAAAQHLGVNALVAASSEADNFTYIPTTFDFPAGLDYVHLTTNNTIFGTQFAGLPKPPADAKLVIDMSSDFLSRPIDWTNVGLVYAGAQKNAGPAGVTIVIIDKEYYGREKPEVPEIFRYSTYGKNESAYNTPPCFQIYAFGLVLAWIQQEGGLGTVAEHNQKKAALIYNAIDAHPEAFVGHARQDSRSLMNVTFNLKDKSREAAFLKGAEERKLMGLKGHRSVGGFRASIYNAMSVEGCRLLGEYMRAFAGS